MLQDLVIAEGASLEILFNKDKIKLEKHKKWKNRCFMPRRAPDTYLKVEKKEKCSCFIGVASKCYSRKCATA